MDLISLQDCRAIAEKCLGSENVVVLKYEITSFEEAAAGFIGASKSLRITAEKDGNTVELDFFTKTLPENEYHRKNVLETKNEVKTNVKNLLASNPSLLSPSKTFRNALAHADLWTNNIMFQYDSSKVITDCILVDYQLVGYCPPSVDVYSMIFI
ncbi:hypothetical protein GE061_012969, partial [Apolygus lucorum]